MLHVRRFHGRMVAKKLRRKSSQRNEWTGRRGFTKSDRLLAGVKHDITSDIERPSHHPHLYACMQTMVKSLIHSDELWKFERFSGYVMSAALQRWTAEWVGLILKRIKLQTKLDVVEQY